MSDIVLAQQIKIASDRLAEAMRLIRLEQTRPAALQYRGPWAVTLAADASGYPKKVSIQNGRGWFGASYNVAASAATELDLSSYTSSTMLIWCRLWAFSASGYAELFARAVPVSVVDFAGVENVVGGVYHARPIAEAVVDASGYITQINQFQRGDIVAARSMSYFNATVASDRKSLSINNLGIAAGQDKFGGVSNGSPFTPVVGSTVYIYYDPTGSGSITSSTTAPSTTGFIIGEMSANADGTISAYYPRLVGGVYLPQWHTYAVGAEEAVSLSLYSPELQARLTGATTAFNTGDADTDVTVVDGVITEVST